MDIYAATVSNTVMNILIFAGTVGGIIGMIGLILWMSGATTKSGEKVQTMGHVWDEDLAEFNNPLPSWWLGLFYITLIFGIIYLVLFPGLGAWGGILKWTSAGQYDSEMQAAAEKYDPIYEAFKDKPIPELAKDENAVGMGHRLFLTYCTVCHGSDATGANKGFPNLTDNDWLYGGKPENIEKSIRDGRKATGMMAWKDTLGGDENVKNVAQYVLSLSGREHNTEAATQGQQKFMICMGCHGPDGKGNQMLGAPNLTDNTWLYGGKTAEIEESIGKGRSGVMPAHGEFLGDAKVHLLAAYVYSLSNK